MKNFLSHIVPFITAYVVFCITVLLHEWAHSLTATIFGIKSSVFDIHYSWQPFLMGIHEKVDYALVAKLTNWKSILICGSGLIANFFIAILALLILKKCIKPSIIFVTYLFAFFNISEWFNYMVLRNIFPRGDIADMVKFGFPHSLLLLIGIITSTAFLFFLFQVTKQHFKKHLGAFIIIFILMQIGTLYNALMMY